MFEFLEKLRVNISFIFRIKFYNLLVFVLNQVVQYLTKSHNLLFRCWVDNNLASLCLLICHFKLLVQSLIVSQEVSRIDKFLLLIIHGILIFCTHYIPFNVFNFVFNEFLEFSLILDRSSCNKFYFIINKLWSKNWNFEKISFRVYLLDICFQCVNNVWVKSSKLNGFLFKPVQVNLIAHKIIEFLSFFFNVREISYYDTFVLWVLWNLLN